MRGSVCGRGSGPSAADGAGARGRDGQRCGTASSATRDRTAVSLDPRQGVAHDRGGYTASCPEGRSCSRRRQGAR